MKKHPWWEERLWPALRYGLLRSIGRARFLHATWLQKVLSLASKHWRGINTAKGRALTKKLVRTLCDDPEQVAAFEAVYMLHGGSAPTGRWLTMLLHEPRPKLTPEQRADRTREAARHRREANEKHARQMLAKHERALAREEAAVARWRRKVAVYDKRTPAYTPVDRAPARPAKASAGRTGPRGRGSAKSAA